MVRSMHIDGKKGRGRLVARSSLVELEIRASAPVQDFNFTFVTFANCL